MKIKKEILTALDYGILINIPTEFDTAAVIDSRKLEPGMIFFALQGEHTDGHHYVLTSQEKNPAFCVVEQGWYDQNYASVKDLSLWVVENSEKALQLLGHKIRQLSNIPLFALTGTNGKTSTRSMITAVLNQKYNVISTQGNLNNHLGLPLSLLRITENHDFAVMEMGTNHFGEIKFLCDIAEPNYGLITNIGRGHTEFLESPAGVAKAKEELFTSIPKDGVIFINDDDNFIPYMKLPAKHVVKYGIDSIIPDYKGDIKSVDTLGRGTLTVNNKVTINLNIPGVYQAFNALAAVTVGHYFGVSYDQIKTALENFQGVSNRLGLKKTTYTIIDDTYNANPESTIGAIRTLHKIETTYTKYFILGDMLELGDKEEEYHREIGREIAQSNINHFYTFGKLTIYAHDEARKSGMLDSIHFDSKEKMINKLNAKLNPHDILLVKGSRGAKMEEIIEGITG